MTERSVCLSTLVSIVTESENEWFTTGDPSLFNPERLDADQWVSVAQSLGARYIVFTAKHADGFCLWQTETSDYGVRQSGWMSGQGDVVEEISDACARAGIAFGVYLSPADAYLGVAVGGVAADRRKQAEYDRIYRAQLTELLTRYGDICEVWFDGSCIVEVGDISPSMLLMRWYFRAGMERFAG